MSALVTLCRGERPEKIPKQVQPGRGLTPLADDLDLLFEAPVEPEPVPEPVTPPAEEEEEKTQEEPFDWSEATVLLSADDGNRPTKLSYQRLVREIESNWPKQYDKRTKTAWYQAVRRWCIRNGLSLRKVNRTTPERPRVTQ